MPFEGTYTDSESDFKKIPRHRVVPYRLVRAELEGDGWKTPDTYCRAFDYQSDFSAVYLFLLVDQYDYLSASPAYVGMSTNLAQRWSGHPILNDIDMNGVWVQRWFLRVPHTDLRSVENSYIQKFDPPWNISGRKRGIVL